MEYKLIKKYPSLPADWEVGMVVGIGDRCAPTCFSPCSGKYKEYYVPWGEVTGSPEYWEKVEEKPFEILSYICLRGDGKHTTQIFNKTPDGRYSWDGVTYSEDYIKKVSWNDEDGGYVIHSVKRLSDGEVFTLGDVVNFSISERVIITSFKYEEGRLIVMSNRRRDGLNFATKVNQPLFTTHDGVDIYEGDKCWAGDPSEGISDFCLDSWEGHSSYMLYFSTREAAEDYLMKDVRFSFGDIKKAIGPFTSGTFINANKLIETLKESVKLK